MITASLVINSIHSSLNALERWNKYRDYHARITGRLLENLELFVLCARKLGNDEQLRFEDAEVSTLGSLFQRIHHAIPCNWDWTIHWNFDMAISNLRKDIDRWYNTLLVSLPQPTFDEAADIIYAVLENLYGISHTFSNVFSYDREPKSQLIEVMIEKITFLRNFIRFATLRSIEPRQLDNLLVRIQAVAVDAAHTSYICIVNQHNVVAPNFPVLLQMIKMVDPQVDETYTQALTSSKLSTKLLSPTPDKDHDPSVIMKDFVDSLLRNLWERLCTDTRIVFSTNSELLLVYQGLGLLRSMLKEQPNKFDRRIGELTRVVICDAGITIFSLYKRHMEIVVPTSCLLQRINTITQTVKKKEFSISNLLQRISRIRQRVKGKDLPIPNLLPKIHAEREQVGGNELPRTNELGFIDFVLENLLGITSSKACYGFESQFRMIHEELSSLRHSFGEIEEVRNEQKDLEALWNAGMKVVYGVEFLIDQLVFGDFQCSSSTSFDSTVEEILKEVKSIYSKIHHASTIKVKKVSMTPNPILSQKRDPVADEIVGFDDDMTSIINRLTRGSKELKMVAIVDMPGIGKTTLATKVFNHPSVTSLFYARLRCCVSQVFHKKNVLLELLNPVDPKTYKKSENDLAEELRRHLKGRRYLIFLDDVWDIKAWESLKISFPDNNDDWNGSRILVTSRLHNALPQAMLDEKPHSLHLLNDDQSWELLQKKLPSRIEWSPRLDELGKQIAANCKGLPLTVVVVAGLLANTEPQGWNIFLESISSFSGSNHCMNVLELSYKHLPGHLKECFLYFGLFPENYELSVKRMIWLWIAEGFVCKTESKRLEDAARDYLMDLVGRSLVIVSKERSRGGVKVCRVHDLLHDFCRTKAEEENFFQLLRGCNELLSFEEPDYMRRLCVHSEGKHLKNLRLFCLRLHSLLFFSRDERLFGQHDEHDISFIIPGYCRLRLLEIGQYSSSYWNGIPNEIGLVLQLKYLSVRVYISDVPSSIGRLTNLETFILESNNWRPVSVPDTFWNLQKLRHVVIADAQRNYFVANEQEIKEQDIEELSKRKMHPGFRLAFENLEKFPELFELQSCSGIIISPGESIERLMRKFPNIRKLSCNLDLEDSNEIEILKLVSLSQLESLHMRMKLRRVPPQFGFDFPCNLRKLSLTSVFLNQRNVSSIGNLPNLEVLKFCAVNFDGDRWDMVEGEFSKLKFLKLSESGIVRWTSDSDEQFPSLEKLVLDICFRLEDIPDCFENICTLEIVELRNCRDPVNSFFKGIEDQQREFGNSLPKIQIYNWDDPEEE